jgi:hypothetical protein
MAMWYSAVLWFQGQHSGLGVQADNIWEERILLIEAENEDVARRRAEEIGKRKHHEYPVSQPRPHLLKWTLDRVIAIVAIDGDQPSDGVELFSRYLQQSEVESLIKGFPNDSAGS